MTLGSIAGWHLARCRHKYGLFTVYHFWRCLSEYGRALGFATYWLVVEAVKLSKG